MALKDMLYGMDLSAHPRLSTDDIPQLMRDAGLNSAKDAYSFYQDIVSRMQSGTHWVAKGEPLEKLLDVADILLKEEDNRLGLNRWKKENPESVYSRMKLPERVLKQKISTLQHGRKTTTIETILSDSLTKENALHRLFEAEKMLDDDFNAYVRTASKIAKNRVSEDEIGKLRKLSRSTNLFSSLRLRSRLARHGFDTAEFMQKREEYLNAGRSITDVKNKVSSLDLSRWQKYGPAALTTIGSLALAGGLYWLLDNHSSNLEVHSKLNDLYLQMDSVSSHIMMMKAKLPEAASQLKDYLSEKASLESLIDNYQGLKAAAEIKLASAQSSLSSHIDTLKEYATLRPGDSYWKVVANLSQKLHLGLSASDILEAVNKLAVENGDLAPNAFDKLNPGSSYPDGNYLAKIANNPHLKHVGETIRGLSEHVTGGLQGKLQLAVDAAQGNLDSILGSMKSYLAQKAAVAQDIAHASVENSQIETNFAYAKGLLRDLTNQAESMKDGFVSYIPAALTTAAGALSIVAGNVWKRLTKKKHSAEYCEDHKEHPGPGIIPPKPRSYHTITRPGIRLRMMDTHHKPYPAHQVRESLNAIQNPANIARSLDNNYSRIPAAKQGPLPYLHALKKEGVMSDVFSSYCMTKSNKFDATTRSAARNIENIYRRYVDIDNGKPILRAKALNARYNLSTERIKTIAHALESAIKYDYSFCRNPVISQDTYHR